jgi:hypothetical protein
MKAMSRAARLGRRYGQDTYGNEEGEGRGTFFLDQ